MPKKTSFSQFEVKKKPKAKAPAKKPKESTKGIFERERAKLAKNAKPKPKAKPKKKPTAKAGLVNRAERDMMKKL